LSNGNTYAYNAAGSAVTYVIGADSYSLAYDSENRLKTVQKNGAALAEFKYDGDGTRVQSTINGVTTKFVGEYYEVTGTTVTKYYGGAAMRVGGTLYYLLSDHLGTNSLILDTAGNVVGETRYTAWGEERYSSGSVSTDYTYTGQYSNTDDFGLMYYKARWYDPQLGRFAQADSIVPGAGNPLAWDRYSYVKNNPIIQSDPSGHNADCSIADPYCNGRTPKVFKYSGDEAAKWAKKLLDKDYCTNQSNCTRFVSDALYSGRLPMDDIWFPAGCDVTGNSAWITTDNLYTYLTQNVKFETKTLDNPINYEITNLDRGALSAEPTIQDYVATNIDMIKPGTLIFYLDPSNYNGTWSHVAIVVGVEKDSDGILKPVIVDQSSGQDVPRFYDATPNLSITKISFVFAGVVKE
jgi:RHS repeat-associated protein